MVVGKRCEFDLTVRRGARFGSAAELAALPRSMPDRDVSLRGGDQRGCELARWKFWASRSSSHCPWLLAFAARMLRDQWREVAHDCNERVHKYSKRISKWFCASSSKLDTVELMTVAHEVLMDMLCAEVTTEAFRPAGWTTMRWKSSSSGGGS